MSNAKIQVKRLGDLLEQVLSITREEFVQEHPSSFLVAEAAQKPAKGDAFQTMATPRERSCEATLWEVYPVAKSERNSFTNMITIGRTQNNDVVLEESSVSKFHAYLQQKEGRWHLSDAGSRFGCTVDGVKLTDKSVEVNCKSKIVLGTGLLVKLYSSGELYDLIRVFRGLGKL